jgi:3-methyladenine DNA glycosylase AlkC
MEQITPISSCEFAIRPFLKRYSQETLLQMQAWSRHPNEHVRRLASEGCRPRLPWGMSIDLLKKSPDTVLPILEQLKNDDSEYVRRSVANNLNDISKDHPSLVLELAANWLGKTPNTDRLLKHACRGLLKSGNSNALRLFGTASDVPCAVSDCQLLAPVITKGERIQFSFELHLQAKTDAVLRIEYAVHFVKANGKAQPKVFKIGERLFRPEQKLRFSRSHSFKDLTTRKHYAGSHQLVIIINGIAKQSVSFLLLEDHLQS